MELVSQFALFTVGQGARKMSDLIAQLKAREIRFLCDVRSNPISNFAPEFCMVEMKAALRTHDIKYIPLGHLLGGRPKDQDLYTKDGYVDYTLLIESQNFVHGLERVISGVEAGHRLVLFCSEGAPEACHRTKAIGRALAARGINVRHIDVDDQELSQDVALGRLTSQLELLPGVETVALSSRKKYT